jgi:hypothetical protein
MKENAPESGQTRNLPKRSINPTNINEKLNTAKIFFLRQKSLE